MPYPSGHRPAVKKAIIDSARKLFNRHGFESVSIQQIMAGAGLTHGGFYSYFDSKSDLYAEVLNCFFIDPNWKSCWEGVKVDLSSADVGPQVVRAYLSRQHFENVRIPAPWSPCPRTSRAAANPPGAPSRPSSAPWLASSSAACSRTAALAEPPRRASLLYASEAWSSPAHSSTPSSPKSCATPACRLRSASVVGPSGPSRKIENSRRREHL